MPQLFHYLLYVLYPIFCTSKFNQSIISFKSDMFYDNILLLVLPYTLLTDLAFIMDLLILCSNIMKFLNFLENHFLSMPLPVMHCSALDSSFTDTVEISVVRIDICFILYKLSASLIG